ncbi:MULTISPECIES: 2-oxoacid:acceptor oxidoreductase subunit alpha [Thermotoga]|jgi:2-oxoglutarate ferredoxin oxidoreductase subunit alpha|uniref:Pyruvate:ferredoxin 2-oxidoreductase-related protein n=1 Tax=Thermotoga neapolitana (strain ATCC 49049 / DSM 4359 / NBRC 107923 / NS-E) TaxID=309803 RepID=B9KA90_THENN|nr:MULTISPECIES: 2-oxoacid:acceptor oxidoreductase subunit alpha [Thermotoga]MDK2786022.1 2-oxoglutarate/2-oxoacid ferredoxin oxidoreductase subunit alpha [Thermotoga sp.]HBF10712.1 2-oxoacid:acceptor oxidoreductase subunit alpha [Thermotoga neapolitana]ACM23873.1 Pyruvate:ferredoxin 2-oxidoreductase-related protein [Thermotoga neapolitana DSM 4359]AJG39904.1 2-oxoglutarate ferredoxin oxidoreductase subunit alpha [Thermotoga sp. RQ7]KFZ21066.1 2-oxoglutarate ferredoxin oxidoreductase subunit a
MPEMMFLQGNEACALGAIRAGCRFFAGYPITPSTEIAEVMARELPKVGGVFIQMEDEIASAAAVVGASLAGVKAMTATSGPGFSLMQEVIGYAIMTETPCVFVNVMRLGPSTGLPTKPAQGDIMQARWGTHGDHAIIALYPSTVEEVYRHIITAFNMAEEYRTPVIFLMDETLGHMRESFYPPKDEDLFVIERLKDTSFGEEELFVPFSESEYAEPTPLPMAEMGRTKFHVSGLVHDESGFPLSSPNVAEKLIRRLTNKIRLHSDELALYEEYEVEDAEILVVAYGIVARSALKAVKIARRDRIKVGLFKPITIWPAPISRFRKLVEKVNTIIIAEMNLGQYAKELISAIDRKSKVIRTINKVNGELIKPEEILDVITETQIEI